MKYHQRKLKRSISIHSSSLIGLVQNVAEFIQLCSEIFDLETYRN